MIGHRREWGRILYEGRNLFSILHLANRWLSANKTSLQCLALIAALTLEPLAKSLRHACGTRHEVAAAQLLFTEEGPWALGRLKKPVNAKTVVLTGTSCLHEV